MADTTLDNGLTVGSAAWLAREQQWQNNGRRHVFEERTGHDIKLCRNCNCHEGMMHSTYPCPPDPYCEPATHDEAERARLARRKAQAAD